MALDVIKESQYLTAPIRFNEIFTKIWDEYYKKLLKGLTPNIVVEKQSVCVYSVAVQETQVDATSTVLSASEQSLNQVKIINKRVEKDKHGTCLFANYAIDGNLELRLSLANQSEKRVSIPFPAIKKIE